MANTKEDIDRLRAEFSECRELFAALGDENRQHLLLIMMEGPCEGSRVIDIARRTHLSRPAVSHHIQILKNAGIIRARKEGTMIYYYLDPDRASLEAMIALFSDMKKIVENAPERSEYGTGKEGRRDPDSCSPDGPCEC